MKLPPLRHWFAPFAALLLAPSLHAIDITAAPVPDPFPAPPWPATGDAIDVTADWTTRAVGGGADGAITDALAFDAKIIAAPDAEASTITAALGSSATIPPSTIATGFRYNRGTNAGGVTFLQSRPTTVDYFLLLAHLTNATGAPLSTVRVAYDYSKATDAAGEEVKGLRAYWSVSGAAGSWALIPELSIDTTGTYDVPQAVTADITLPAALPDAGTMFILWADQNSNGVTDPSYHIGNFAVSVAGPPACAITGTAANVVRSPGASGVDPSDDTVSFSVTVTGTGPLSPSGWGVAAPLALVGNAGSYGVAQTISGIPISNFPGGNLQLRVQDSDAQAACQATVNVRVPVVIGSSDLVAAGTPILTNGNPLGTWVMDETQRTSTQKTAPGTDEAITSEIINLSAAGDVLLRAELDATAGTSSGFEAGDGFVMEVIIDGAPAASVLGLSDADISGRLNGGAAGPSELPDATVTSYTQTFAFAHVIPAAANDVQIRFIGNSNSNNETFVVKNLKLSPAAPLLSVSSAGVSTIDHKNTVTEADDEFSGRLNITAVGFAGVNWESDETPARTGAYATNPNVFGPYLVTGGAKTVTIHDQTTPAIVSGPWTIPLPPDPVLTASAPANITHHLDGTVTFESTVTSTNAGPSWTVTGATASSNTYGTTPVTFTIPAPVPVSPVAVTLTDASYPAVPTATVALSVVLPAIYTIGKTDLGGGPQDLLTSTSNVLWVNDAGLLTLTMSAGVAADSIVASHPIDLSTVGAVNFSAKFNIADSSTGTNLEIGDKFKAELLIDSGLATATVINLIDAWDVGDGANATAVATAGANGPKNGYLNGYNGTIGTDQITLIAYATAAEEYNANSDRDEFNPANPDRETVDQLLNNDFLLSYVIPATANSVQLKIYGAGFAGSEIATVSDVLFTLAAASNDTDGDGVSNTDEDIMGTSPTDPNDVLRLTQSPANPTLFTFPTEADRYYRVYFSDDSNEATHLTVWKDAGLGTIPGNGNPAQFNITVTPGETRRFYRLHVMKTDGVGGVWPATYP